MKRYLKKSMIILLAFLIVTQVSIWAASAENAVQPETNDAVEVLPAKEGCIDLLSDQAYEDVKYGLAVGVWTNKDTYKKETVNCGNEDGTNTFTASFYCDVEEDWIDSEIEFVVENVTPTAVQQIYRDMNVACSSISVTIKSAKDNIAIGNSLGGVYIQEPFTENGPGGRSTRAISGKRLTIDTDPGVRAIKVSALRNGEVVDYVYFGTSGRDSSNGYSAYNIALNEQVRYLVEKQLWTDDMSNHDKIGAVVTYINETTHYPNTTYVSREYNPTFWADWSVDDTDLFYNMFNDELLNEIMKLQGGITTCWAADLIVKMAEEDLGLPNLYDSDTGTIAEGEGVWTAMGSRSLNPSEPSHKSIGYQSANGEIDYWDAQGMGYGSAGSEKSACEVHGCREKIVPLVSENISNSTVSLSQTEFIFDGSEKKPGVTVTYNGAVLTEGKDYTVRYSDNVDPGTATVMITGKGDYTGTVIKNYSIVSQNGFVQENGNWLYYTNGKADTSRNDVIQGTVNGQNGWWYVVGGKVQLNYTGVCDYSNENGWWYVVNGKVDFGKTGIEPNSYGWWRVVGGKVDFSCNSVEQNDYGWWYLVGGQVQFGYTGVANYANAYGWWYIKDGKVDFGMTGIEPNNYGWWRVVNGQVDFGCNSVEQNNYGWWYLVGGQVQFGYTGVANYANANGWWYINGGKVDFSKTSVEPNAYGWWRVEGGKVNFSYTGWASNGYGRWYCVNGKVDFSRS